MSPIWKQDDIKKTTSIKNELKKKIDWKTIVSWYFKTKNFSISKTFNTKESQGLFKKKKHCKLNIQKKKQKKKTYDNFSPKFEFQWFII